MEDKRETPLDLEYLSSITGGDYEFEAEIIQEFLASAVELMAELDDALDAGDASGVNCVAHTLKGSARAIGADDFSDVCSVIEQAAKAGNLEGLDGQRTPLHERYADVRSFAASFFKRAA